MDIKGYTYGYGAKKGDWRSPEGEKSQDLLYGLNNNWICLAVLNFQDAFYSTEIKFDFARTPTERDIMFAVEKAHKRGVKVCLKPMLNSDDMFWRAYIKFPDEVMHGKNPYWDKWFESYTNYMLYYAELAEELKIEMLCIGCEMNGTEHREEEWSTLIKQLRKVYSGKLVYNTNHHREDESEWTNALDYIGTSAYYRVGQNGTDKKSMVAEWEKIREGLNKVADKRGKKYLFMEIGCRSAEGCSDMPWDFSRVDLPFNEQEQSDFYGSCLEVFGKEERFAGVFWWDWSTFIYDSADVACRDVGFNIHLKKAEKVLQEMYKVL